MDEKRSISTQPDTHAPNTTMSHPRSARRCRILAALSIVLFIVYYTCYTWYPANINVLSPYDRRPLRIVDDEPASPNGLVPLEAHIMSKCPDTRDAMRELILPAMERISDKVDFKLTYIGKTTANDGVDCKHGPSECMGNIIELCAREVYPDPKINLGFIMCLTNDYPHVPERALVEDCALEHAIDINALNECAARDDGAHGLDMLRASVERSAKLDISTSCTLRLNNEVYCVRNGGEWTDCPHGSSVNDLVIAIEKLSRA